MKYENTWLLNSIPEEDVEELAQKAGITKLLAKVFLGRDIHDVEYIRKFLKPCLSELHNPFLLKDMDKAVDRILTAIENGDRILIYGDYDVDGVTSTTILYDFLLSQRAKVDYFIPDRLEEGYGLSISAIDRILERSRIELVITVDCGITAFEEVNYFNEKDIDVIITDHHECKESLPNAFAIINPCRNDCTYPFKELAGVGVAFKLIEAIAEKMNHEVGVKCYLDLVALGTVADVVPLLGENRIIVKHGLDMIEKTSNAGLRSIIKVAAIEGRKITSSVISFMIAPRVNAAGRIGDACRAVRLLTTDNDEEAMQLANELDELNRYRQDSEMDILQGVEKIIDSDIDLEKERVIVVSGLGWHHGIIGIVASKITEKYNRPCILISVEEETGKGSGRSIDGFNLFKALEYCEDTLERYGGHELAAGLTLKTQSIDMFRRKINEFAGSVLDSSVMLPKIKIDACISKESLTLDSVRELELLAPFGANNPSPVFALYNNKICDIRAVGKDKHIKLKLCNNDFFVDAIGFNKGKLVNVYNEADVVDVACSVDINAWNGSESVQLNIKDVRSNRDTLMENNYYFSLDKCIDFKYEYSDNDINIIFSQIKQTEHDGD
ncbi:MAG: single-stranded-DNA-specific exonuclease RecJ, partial [Clostridiaceae bacterium]|nr:single-stranded-DNA-specific exonuclease RecJ [Clostridiaceae bacterium]